jgi:hypothetical protein
MSFLGKAVILISTIEGRWRVQITAKGISPQRTAFEADRT